MSDIPDTDGLPTIDDEAPEPEPASTGKELRSELEKRIADGKSEDAEIERLQQEAMGRAFRDLDLDPERGIGKAASMIYDGEPSGLGEFVEAEFGHIPNVDHPMAGKVTTEQARLDTVGSSAGSVPVTPAIEEVLAKSQATGDVKTAININAARLERLMHPERGG